MSAGSPTHPAIEWKDFTPFLLGMINVYRWRTLQHWKHRIYEFYSAIGYFGLTVLIVEIFVELAHLFGHISTRLVDPVVSFLSTFFGPSTLDYAKTASRFASIVVLSLLLALLKFKRMESREYRRLDVFLKSTHMAMTELDTLSLQGSVPAADSAALRTCIEEILKILLDTFALKGSLSVNVMIHENEELVMKYVRAAPGVKYDDKFKPKPGQGGAGLSFQEQSIVYFPNYKWRHGVLIRPVAGKLEHTVYLNLYQPVNPACENYQSILSTPVAAHHNCYGVLNLDSRLSNPLTESDYLVLTFFGAMIGLALNRYQGYYP